MKKTQKGFILPLVIVIVAVLGIGGYVYNQKLNSEIKNNTIKENSTTTEDININTTSTDISTESIINNANKVKDEANNLSGKKIITEVKIVKDSLGKTGPVFVIDPKIATEEMLKKVNKDVYMKNLLNTQISVMLGSFENDAWEYKNKNGSYSGLCNNSKELLASHAGINQTNGDEASIELYKQTGTTIESYKINQSICKSNDKSYVLTMPIPLKDGTEGVMCTSERVGTASPVVIGQADFNTFTCINKETPKDTNKYLIENTLCKSVPSILDYYSAWGGTFNPTSEKMCDSYSITTPFKPITDLGYSIECKTNDKSFAITVTNKDRLYCIDSSPKITLSKGTEVKGTNWQCVPNTENTTQNNTAYTCNHPIFQFKSQ